MTSGAGAFEQVVAAFAGQDDVTVRAGRGFGSGTLQVSARIFAMTNDVGLVLKLPVTRVAALIAACEGLPFDAGKGRPMKEWVVVPSRHSKRWSTLAHDALEYVQGPTAAKKAAPKSPPKKKATAKKKAARSR